MTPPASHPAPGLSPDVHDTLWLGPALLQLLPSPLEHWYRRLARTHRRSTFLLGFLSGLLLSLSSITSVALVARWRYRRVQRMLQSRARMSRRYAATSGGTSISRRRQMELLPGRRGSGSLDASAAYDGFVLRREPAPPPPLPAGAPWYSRAIGARWFEFGWLRDTFRRRRKDEEAMRIVRRRRQERRLRAKEASARKGEHGSSADEVGEGDVTPGILSPGHQYDEAADSEVDESEDAEGDSEGEEEAIVEMPNVIELRSGDVVDGIEGLIGNTPLLRLPRLSQLTGCQILGKAEFLNPGGSPKDRVALRILDDAERRGWIKPFTGSRVFEGTVGSTGISLATLCRAKGYECSIVLPDDVAKEKAELLRKLGAETLLVRPRGIADPGHFVNEARARAEAFGEQEGVEPQADTGAAEDKADAVEALRPPSTASFYDGAGASAGSAKSDGDATEATGSDAGQGPPHAHPPRPRGFFADQFESESNFLCHYEGTGPEIWRQTGGLLDAFVAGAGTGGTLAGVGAYLKGQVERERRRWERVRQRARRRAKGSRFSGLWRWMQGQVGSHTDGQSDDSDSLYDEGEDRVFADVAPAMAWSSEGARMVEAQAEEVAQGGLLGFGFGWAGSGPPPSAREFTRDVRVVLADPQGSGLFNKVKYNVVYSQTEAEGTRRRHQVDTVVEGIGLNRLTHNFSLGLSHVDDAERVTDAEAVRMSRWLVVNEGLFLGSSSAVNIVAAVRTALKMKRERAVAGNGDPNGATTGPSTSLADAAPIVVTILCDSGARHLSKFHNDEALAKLGVTDVRPYIDDILEL